MPIMLRMVLAVLMALMPIWALMAEQTEPVPENGIDDPPVTSDAPTAAFIEVVGEINDRQLRYMERALADAEAAGAEIIITRIESPGGQLGAAEDLLRLVTDDASNGPRMIAFIDQAAHSAAAMLAYGHGEIYMEPGSEIGDIGVIFINQEGEIQYAPEKIETAVRAMLESTSEVRGWNKALMLKMTARNQELYEVRFPDGRIEYVIEDDKATFLADHDGVIDPEDPTQWILLAGKDRLLTFSTNRAIELGMATGVVANLEDLYAQLGLDPERVIDLAPTDTEMMARQLGGIAPVLISLALLFLLFELKTPGVGLWAGLAVACGAAYFAMQYYQDLAANWEIVLMAIGVALLLIEVFTAIGGGAIGIAGGLALLFGLVATFLPNDMSWDFDSERTTRALGNAAVDTMIVVAMTGIGLVAFIALAPRLPFLDRISNVATIAGTSAGRIEQGHSSHGDGQRAGVVQSELHPGGSIMIDGEVVSARSEHGQFIASGTAVVVVKAQFGELVVRPAPETAPATSEEIAT